MIKEKLKTINIYFKLLYEIHIVLSSFFNLAF